MSVHRGARIMHKSYHKISLYSGEALKWRKQELGPLSFRRTFNFHQMRAQLPYPIYWFPKNFKLFFEFIFKSIFKSVYQIKEWNNFQKKISNFFSNFFPENFFRNFFQNLFRLEIVRQNTNHDTCWIFIIIRQTYLHNEAVHLPQHIVINLSSKKCY